MKKITALLLISFTLTFAQVTKTNIFSDTRYDYVPAKELNRQQARVRIGLTIDAHSIVEIVSPPLAQALTMTGSPSFHLTAQTKLK